MNDREIEQKYKKTNKTHKQANKQTPNIPHDFSGEFRMQKRITTQKKNEKTAVPC